MNMMRVWACKVYPPFVYACVSGSGRRRGGNELCLLLLALVSRMVSSSVLVVLLYISICGCENNERSHCFALRLR